MTVAASPVRGPIRLTRRGRVVAVLVLMAMLVVSGFALGRGSSQAAGRGPTGGQQTVTVEPGESLWAVAARVAPHQDPRLVVSAIEARNALAGPAVAAGEQLVIPTLS